MLVEGMGDMDDLTGEFAKQIRPEGLIELVADLSEKGLVELHNHEKGIGLNLTRRGAEALAIRRTRGSLDTFLMLQISLHQGLVLSDRVPS